MLLINYLYSGNYKLLLLILKQQSKNEICVEKLSLFLTSNEINDDFDSKYCTSHAKWILAKPIKIDWIKMYEHFNYKFIIYLQQ